MIEIKKDKFIINGNEKMLKNVNIIKTEKDGLCFSNRFTDCVDCEYDTNDLYQSIVGAGLKGFMMANDVIVNLNNVESMFIKYYQLAGISIHACKQDHADLCLLTLVCKNGRTESIPFNTHKEAEKCYHEIDSKLSDLKNEEVVEKLLNT